MIARNRREPGVAAPITVKFRRSRKLPIVPPATHGVEDLDDDDRLALAMRPQTRADCSMLPRPCVFVSCKYNLWLDVNENGSVKFNRPDLEPGEMPAKFSCALDVAERGGAQLAVVGRAMNIVRERVRQIVLESLASFRWKKIEP